MPDDNGTAVHAAELLLRRGRIDDAAELLRAAAGRDPDDARMLRVLSAVEMMLDRLDAALFKRLPFTARYAWYAVALLSEPRYAAAAAAEKNGAGG